MKGGILLGVAGVWLICQTLVASDSIIERLGLK